MRKLVPVLPVLLLVLAACGGDHPEVVAVDTFRFSPPALTVPTGSTVRWENRDSILHTVTADDGAFDLQLDGKGATAERTFPDEGTFRYRCDRHRGMTGTVTVIRS